MIAQAPGHEQREQILRTVADLVRGVMDEAWTAGVPITMDTSFADDLELESIEFVALAERLRETYGEAVDLPGWLAGKELKEIIALRVGTLVEHIDQCLSRSTTG